MKNNNQFCDCIFKQWIAWAAFTKYICQECKKEYSHHNARIPQLCSYCCNKDQCPYCLKQIPKFSLKEKENFEKEIKLLNIKLDNIKKEVSITDRYKNDNYNSISEQIRILKIKINL